jgi:cation transporter-like permease
MLALTLATVAVMSTVSTILGSLLWGLAPASFSDVLAVVVATMNLELTLYLFILLITFAAFKKGLDLDSVAYPIAATIADVFITVCYALAVNVFFNFGHAGKYAVLLIALLPAVLMLYCLFRSIHEEGVSKTMKTSILALMFVAVIASVTGAILQEIHVGVSL